jgi:phytoene dehydrogenase-like protein
MFCISFQHHLYICDMEKNDIVIVGGGHNALVAACYLAKAGRKVLILEKNDYIGGATTSKRIFDDYDVQLSQYSYLVSLLPQKIIDELDLNLNLMRRSTASYTPYANDRGLIFSNIDESISRESVLALGYGESEWEGLQTILTKQQTFAALVWDSFVEPLQSRVHWQQKFDNQSLISLWNEFVERPIGELIEKNIASDLLRGVLMTDAKIGSFTHAHDASLLQNRTFLYHIVGNKTGEWRVPKGGMGQVANQLINKALSLGVTFKTGAEVTDVLLKKNIQTVHFIANHTPQAVEANDVLLNVIPPSLRHLTNQTITDEDEGTAFKINILLNRLPQLKNKNIKPEVAFAGTFHVNQSYSQMEESYKAAEAGSMPSVFPFEMYCHTLTDPSIMADDLREKGFHTITVFGIDMAYRLFKNDNETAKKVVLQQFFDGINAYLDEPIQDCLAKDNTGKYCIEVKSAKDLEVALGMARGNIFHW